MQRGSSGIGSGVFRHLAATLCGTFVRRKSGSGAGGSGGSAAAADVSARGLLLIFLVLFLGAFISTRWINSYVIEDKSTMAKDPIPTATKAISERPHKELNLDLIPPPPQRPKASQQIPFSCPGDNRTTSICPAPQSPLPPASDGSFQLCPEYFRWIHEDLRPWKSTGITREMVERARKTANFRLVVLDGRVYMDRFEKSFQSRDVFTLWGILQLLRRYPGRVPDLELMFDCVDWPVVNKAFYHRRNASAPPPLFRYCGDDHSLDIVFPDWSFWGWPEINIRPWEHLLKELKEGNQHVNWMNREPYAYWKGNPWVAAKRQELLKCNVSEKHDSNAHVYAQDWLSESQKAFRQSSLASQCTHRYKIYIEGTAWSVSEKYILACDSLALVVTPRYYDFFTRSLMPVHHYWPIKEEEMCSSIKFAVEWGNSHKQKAQSIAKEASSFIQEKLKMDYVYDYMFHLLNEYAKLLRFKPTKPPNAEELCSESMACPAQGLQKKFMMESMVKTPQDTSPCTLPPQFDPVEMKLFLRRKVNSIRQVEKWEQRTRVN